MARRRGSFFASFSFSKESRMGLPIFFDNGKNEASLPLFEEKKQNPRSRPLMHKDKVLKLAKGFRGRAGNCIRIARERVERALQYATRDRRAKKRDVRSLWVSRINAGAREHGVRTSAVSRLFFILFGTPMLLL